MSDKVYVKVYVETDMVGSRCEEVVEFDREDWEGMSDRQKEDEMKETAFNYMEWGFKELGPDDEDEEIEA